MNRPSHFAILNSACYMPARVFLTTLICLIAAAGAAFAGNIFHCSYDTNLGQLNLVVESGSDTITGDYPSRTGAITGRIRDGVLRGAWRQAKSGKSGYFYLVFDETGDSFNGRWAYTGNKKWRGNWTGNKISWTQDKGNINKSLEWFYHSEGKRLDEGERKLKNVSPDQCAAACLNEKGFNCRSFDYNKADRSCDLTSYQYPNATYLQYDPGYDMYERGNGLTNLEILTRTLYDPPEPSTITVDAVIGRVKGKKQAPAPLSAEIAPGDKNASDAAAGNWYSLAYSPKKHYWYAVSNKSTKGAAEARALKKCNAKCKNTCKTIGTREDEHVSIVVSKKWNVYKSGEDDKQRAFDYCYEQRGPCHLLVRVGPDGVVEKNKVNFKKLKTSKGKQPAKVSPKYRHLFASSEEDLWNGLLSDLGSQIDKETGNEIASTVLSMLKNPDQPKKTGKISLDMRFDSDCSAIRKQARPILNKLGKLLRKEKDVRILIRGHNSGKKNMVPLSLARARSVKKYLVENHDIDPERIKTKGLGNTEPLVRGKTKEAKLVNQRVDIEML